MSFFLSKIIVGYGGVYLKILRTNRTDSSSLMILNMNEEVGLSGKCTLVNFDSNLIE